MQQLLNWKTILQDELTTFDLEDLVIATNGFSHSNKVVEGGFGAVFKVRVEHLRPTASLQKFQK